MEYVFNWGRVVATHEIGPYKLIEYHPWKRDGCIVLRGQPDLSKVEFSGYIDGKDLHQAWSTLDEGLAGLIAIRHNGHNSQAGMYFMRRLNPLP